MRYPRLVDDTTAEPDVIPFPLAPAGTPASTRDEEYGGRWRSASTLTRPSRSAARPGRDAGLDHRSRSAHAAPTQGRDAALEHRAQGHLDDAQRSIDALNGMLDELAPLPFNAFTSDGPEPPRAA